MENSQHDADRLKDDRNIRHYIERSVNHLEEYTRQIDSFVHRSENTFLSVGKSIRDFSKDSRTVGEKSQMLVDSILGKETLSVSSGLVAVLERLSEYTGHLEEILRPHIEKNNRILETLDNLQQSLSDMDVLDAEIKKMIPDQGTASPAGQNNGGDHVIADDVRKLCMKTFLYGEKTRKTLQSADASIRDHASAILDKKYTRRDTTLAIVNSISNVLDSFTEKKRHYKGIEKDITSNATKISESIQEIIIALQFQDITHQALSKVKKGLTELKMDLKAGSGQTSGKPSEEPLSLLEKTATVSSLLEDTLERTRDQFLLAVDVAIKNMNTISNSVASTSDTIHRAAREGFESEQSHLSEIEQNLKGLSTGLAADEGQQSLPEMIRGHIKELITCADDLEHLQSDIQKICRQQPVSQGGNREPSPADPVNIAVSRLFRHTLNLSRSSHTELLKISSDLAELSVDAEDPEQYMAKTIQEEFSSISNRLQLINKEIYSILSYTEKVARDLTSDYEYRIKDLESLKKMNIFVQQMLSDMKQITSYCRSLLPDKSVVKIVVQDKKNQLDLKKGKQAYNPTDLTIDEIVDLYDNIDIF